MIKSWVVKVEQIKIESIDRHISYLLSKTHTNHIESQIKTVLYGEKFDTAFDYRKRLLADAGKPDRASYKNYATSFVFGPPGDFTITDEQAEQITQQVALGLAKILGFRTIDQFEEFKKHLVCVVHNEKSPKNSHFHLLVSNVVNGKFRKELTQYKAKHAIQKVIDIQYKNRFGLNRKIYQPLTENIGKNVPLWKAQIETRQIVLNQEVMDCLNGRIRRYRSIFSKKLEPSRPAKRLLSSVRSIVTNVLQRTFGSKNSFTTDAKTITKTSIEEHKEIQPNEVRNFIEAICDEEQLEPLECDLIELSDMSLESKKSIIERPVVSEHRSAEEIAAAKANFEKLTANFAKPNNSKKYRAFATRKAKNKP